VLIDSPTILGGVFQRCRWVKRQGNRTTLGELLAFAYDILNVVEQQGKFLIEVPEGWVPHKWASAVKADTQRGIEYMQAMKLSDYDVLIPENRREIALLQLLLRELQRLLTIGADVTVQRLGHAFHNINRELRTPAKPGMDAVMGTFRVISADWDDLSLETREGCCRVVDLEVQAAEALINTQGFAINCSGPRQFRIDSLIARSTALHDVRVLGTVRELTVHPPIPLGKDGTTHDAYSLVLEDETGSIVVEVSGDCPPSEPVTSLQGKRVVIDGTLEVLSPELTNRPLVSLKTQTGRVRVVTD